MRLRALTAGAFDLLVVGGGINGAAIAREAARRGLRVALIEKLDYGSGTTSRATRLIHGGLRYLEHGEVMLVLESLRDRERLLRQSPHLVRPLRFIIPVHENSLRGPLTIRAGLILYDLLSAGKAVPGHRKARREQLREIERHVHAPGLKTAFLYYDAQANYPERLTLELVRAARRHGAIAANHCELVRFRLDGRRVRGAVVRDTLAGEEAEIEAAFTLNVTGPWLEQVAGLLPRSQPAPLLSPTRGSHLVVAAFPTAPKDALYFEARSDRRPMFVLPWQGLYLVGTTDLPFAGDPSQVRPTAEEVAYLLSEANGALPGAGLTRDSILFTYAGVRALPHEEGADPGALTRRHFLFDHARHDGIEGLATLIGGKLTTFRSLAADVVNQLGRKLHRPLPTGPDGLELPAFVRWPWQGPPDALEKEVAPEAARHRLEPRPFIRLFELYGEDAARVLELMDRDASLRQPLAPGSPVLRAEVACAVENEQASTVADVLLRRTCAALAPGRGLAEAPQVAEMISPGTVDQALRQYEEEVNSAFPK